MRKGFTLVELLAVLVLLAIIVGFVAINAVGFSNQRKEIDYNNIVSLTIDNTKVLINTNKQISKKVDYNLQTSSTNSCKLEYSVLVDNRLMDKDTKNPKTGEKFNGNIIISLNTQTNEYSYEFDETNKSSELIDCLQ